MAEQGRILVIEDDPDGRRSVQDALQDAGYDVRAVPRGKAGVECAREGGIDVVLTDLVLPDIDGVAVLEAVRQLDRQIPVLVMTAYGSVATAVRALKSGAYDYLLKPLDLDDLLARIGRAVETSRLRAEVSGFHRELAAKYSARAMVAVSPAMQAVLERIASVAGTNATVLIRGESGTGKELVARALHVDGKRAHGPFVALSCGAFTEALLESELFGHEKGAFTGATSRHAGAFERAHGGTLFLDEIGIAPKTVQMRLLRALEEREFLRVGGQAPVKVDVRIVAASNRDLQELVRSGAFLGDLLYRLQVVTIVLPPLRERMEEVRPLAERFVAQAAAEHGRALEAVAPDYFEALEKHPWPGNIRELRHAVESSVILARGATLTRQDLAFERPPADRAAESLRIPAGATLADIEKEALAQALQRHRGNRNAVAQELGVSARTVLRKIKEYALPY